MGLRQDQQVRRSWLSLAKNFPLWRAYKMSRCERQAAEVLDLSVRFQTVPDEELRRIADSLHQEAVNGKPLDDLLVPAFALVREAAARTLKMRHYPVQVVGGIALHKGHIVEMATGEGKTLVATMPAYLNALTDRGVHVVTVNDYLARRDAETMGKVYHFLGLSVGVITHEKSPIERVAAYRASITYGTNKEFGFDFLRDEMRNKSDRWFDHGKRLHDLRVKQVQRPDFHYAIVDEADSVLIDEARTPLIIAQAPEVDAEAAHEFNTAHAAVQQLLEDIDYTYDRRSKKVEWLRSGEQRITRMLGGKRSLTGHRVDWHEACLRALKANVAYQRDVDYIVENNEVVIVDENTGRKMPGRQWEEGLHQAVAAKEKLPIRQANETLARTTYQLYFNRYEKLAGMTGTAMTDAAEFSAIYKIGALKIPTNRPCIRQYLPDRVYGSEEAKWNAIVEEIQRVTAEGRAVLVGTRSIDKSEILSQKLTEANLDHVVLNARHEAREAAIVAKAGTRGRITVATNMAGRGTDIILEREVAEAGGLHVIGTERHESRRVDNQLSGRCARQGDPGSTRFMVSVEDPLMRRYRPRLAAWLHRRYGASPRPLRGWWIRWVFRRLQKSIERQHRKIRYELIKYDRERQKYNRQLGTE